MAILMGVSGQIPPQDGVSGAAERKESTVDSIAAAAAAPTLAGAIA